MCDLSGSACPTEWKAACCPSVAGRCLACRGIVSVYTHHCVRWEPERKWPGSGSVRNFGQHVIRARQWGIQNRVMIERMTSPLLSFA
ncbi:Uncharacterised protein [Mycobacteroides abscessus subsp. abscessus]|nr:Uncharacterised protein [Mycobacteroides abscessus subsp. abscessus]